MANVGSILLEKEILLESGTNEVEVLVFRVGKYRLGINVAKVREILPSQAITQLPQSHESVLGCFQLRDVVVPCVSLHQHLEQESPLSGESNLILTEFNSSQTAFMVDEVERIHRLSWEQILPAPEFVADGKSPVTAVTNIEDNLIIMLDFETIAAEISQDGHEVDKVDNPDGVPRGDARILIADDSATVRKAVQGTLENSGYTNVISFENGRQIWDWIEAKLAETGDVRQVADLVISDVEMPAMDGMHLTRKIKTHPSLKSLPVILFSSILTPDNTNKGKSVGADALITKPQMKSVVKLADDLILKQRSGGTEESSQSQPAATALA